MSELQLITSASSLRQGETIKFSYLREGVKREGFITIFDGKIVCYENVCRHIPISIDYADNKFFTPDGRSFICRTHGAIYEPLTGLCVQGPCEGATLKALPFVCEDGQIWLALPPS